MAVALAVLARPPVSNAGQLETTKLNTANLAGTVSFELPERTLKPGDTETVTIAVAGISQITKYRIELSPRGLQVSSIRKKPIKQPKRGQPWRSEDFDAVPGRLESFDVKLKLTGQGPVLGTRVRNRLTVRLIELSSVGEAAASDQTRLSWPVQDCVSSYLGNLRELASQTKEPMSRLPKQLSERQKFMPGRWLYRPPVTKVEKKYETRTETKTVCARKKRKRVRINGRRRWRTVCVEKKQVEKEVKVEVAADPAQQQLASDEKKLLDYLADYVAERGRGLEFSKKRGRYYWLVRRLPGDLQNYMGQPRNEAICTGGPLLIKYYRSNSAALLKRTQSVYDMRDRAIRLARRRAEKAGARLIRNDKTAHKLLRTLSRRVLTIEERAALDYSAPVLMQLSQIRKIMGARSKQKLATNDGQPTGSVEPVSAGADAAESTAVSDANRKQEEQNALGAIEAAAYAEFIAQRYNKIEAVIFKPMDKISELHKSICQCQAGNLADKASR